MEQLTPVAVRVDSLLDTVEEPIRDFVPHVADGEDCGCNDRPARRGRLNESTPGLSKLAEYLAAPAWRLFRTDLTEFMTVLSDLARRLQPLGQIAESAGTMFGLPPR